MTHVIYILALLVATVWVAAGSLALILWLLGAMSVGRNHHCCGCCDDKLDVKDATW